MMVLGLALIIQTAGLPVDTAEAARICAAIEWRSARKGNLSDLIRSMDLIFLATRETREGRMMENLEIQQPMVVSRARQKIDDLALRGDCRKRFPQAWATSTSLPEDAFDRATLCVLTTGGVAALADAAGDEASKQHWEGVNQRLLRLPIVRDEEARRHGLTSFETSKDYADKLMRQSFDTSGLLVVAEACDAAFPG